jgi:excisionase family DNA binding protein
VPAMDRPRKRLYDLKEASTYLGRSVGALRELIWKGEIPCVKIGRRVHLDIVDMDIFIEQNKARFTF